MAEKGYPGMNPEIEKIVEEIKDAINLNMRKWAGAVWDDPDKMLEWVIDEFVKSSTEKDAPNGKD